MRPLLLLLVIPGVALSARILGINPSASISHQKPFLIIMRALADRGHQVTAITTNPIEDPPKTLTQIDMSFTYPREGQLMDVKEMMLNVLKSPPEKLAEMLLPYNEMLCDAHFNHSEIKELLRQEQKFDLVIMETVTVFCYFGFVHQLGSPPVVGFLSAGVPGTLSYAMGDNVNPAYMADIMTSYSDRMTVWQRLQNTLSFLRQLYSSYTVIYPENDRLIRKYFGPDVPPLGEMFLNISLILTNNHFSASYPQPRLSGVVEMTGLHIEKKRTPLPKDIQQFLDGGEHGVIYFSLGSNMRSIFLPETVIRALLETFSELPQRVLWKFEDDNLPERPENVKIAKWLPQHDVLAHPNIRLFITQGGLQSFNEASYFGVPLLGIPCFGDQPYNVAKMVSAGIGEKLELDEITKESAHRTIRRVLETPSYQENMKQFSAVFREHQETSVDRAVWWVEYVIRHQGARHLRSAARNLRWWQLLLLDVIAFILAATFVAVFLLYKAVRWLLIAQKRPQK
ncbi:UDP-glucosyltransferase 2-like [Schistocerca nitens]|uniref:UDP-glucosyltransferase 2-like n=1 Tax=Schistocerca nitens TaxID=7011 RepID=UPI0021180500|nr:UDP-glucosyltransferase 2-like [Schistocerca nitens]